MFRFSAVVLLCGLALSACSVRPADGEPGIRLEPRLELRDTLDAFLRAQVKSGFSGAVLVVRDGQEVLRRGYSPSGAITPQAAFWIASIAKPSTAAAILKLEEAGRLSTEDRIGRFFDRVPADKRGITIHQLLTHSAGLPSEHAAAASRERKSLAHDLSGSIPGKVIRC